MNGKIDIGQLRSLLEKYFEGETSSCDEEILKQYFASQSDIPQDLEYARGMFGYFADAAGEKPEREYVAYISTKPKKPEVRLTRRMWAWIGSAAAAAAIIIAAAIPLVHSDNQDDGETVVYCYINGEPITDYDLAYAYTQDALGLIEENLSKPGELLVSVADAESQILGLKNLGLLWSDAENECESKTQ